ncbi:prephenate dehydrogenase [Shewanella salipaludis]|uniref:Prephenate dehydrogenase n=1 Tax=Shewanella salipaludis TaxID=2723052 RepID=A0A972FVJ2_9GAMM|nr:prephenate dehydrogenase [Shewanella salipaludis]NMH66850.1 prephenate dehydrogenase [Shewanella salipaludis]
MPHTKVIEQLKENLQLAYRQALDADARLDELKKAGHAKFSTIFTREQGFEAQGNRFLVYVQELAEELDTLQQADKLSATAITHFVHKLGTLLQTLQAFKQNAR